MLGFVHAAIAVAGDSLGERRWQWVAVGRQDGVGRCAADGGDGPRGVAGIRDLFDYYQGAIAGVVEDGSGEKSGALAVVDPRVVARLLTRGKIRP